MKMTEISYGQRVIVNAPEGAFAAVVTYVDEYLVRVVDMTGSPWTVFNTHILFQNNLTSSNF